MNPFNAMVLTAIIVAAGSWRSKSKQIQFKTFVGAGMVAIMLAFLSSVDKELARKFALLILVASLFYYGPDIFGAIQKVAVSTPGSSGKSGLKPGRNGGHVSGGAGGGGSSSW